MDASERERIDQINREAGREQASGDPQATEARDGQPLMVMVAATLAATALVLGMMWMNNMRYDGSNPRPVAEQRQ